MKNDLHVLYGIREGEAVWALNPYGRFSGYESTTAGTQEGVVRGGDLPGVLDSTRSPNPCPSRLSASAQEAQKGSSPGS